MRVGFIWLKAVLVMGCYERGHELSGSIKGREFRVYLSNFQLLKKDSAPLSQNTYVSWNWIVTHTHIWNIPFSIIIVS
jgi:hypothetical protein